MGIKIVPIYRVLRGLNVIACKALGTVSDSVVISINISINVNDNLRSASPLVALWWHVSVVVMSVGSGVGQAWVWIPRSHLVAGSLACRHLPL